MTENTTLLLKLVLRRLNVWNVSVIRSPSTCRRGGFPFVTIHRTYSVLSSQFSWTDPTFVQYLLGLFIYWWPNVKLVCVSRRGQIIYGGIKGRRGVSRRLGTFITKSCIFINKRRTVKLRGRCVGWGGKGILPLWGDTSGDDGGFSVSVGWDWSRRRLGVGEIEGRVGCYLSRRVRS